MLIDSNVKFIKHELLIEMASVHCVPAFHSAKNLTFSLQMDVDKGLYTTGKILTIALICDKHSEYFKT